MPDDIERIAGQLKEACLDPQAWGAALDGINSFLNSSGVVLLSVDERLRHAPCSQDLSELMDDYFTTDWHANDRREACIPLLLRNGIVRDYEVFDADQIEEYRVDFLTRHNRKWFAGIGANLEGDLWCLAVQRSADKGPFLNDDLPRLMTIRARLEEAASFSRLVSRRWLDGAISALESDGSAALILDRDGRIVEMSDAAQSLVHRSRSGSKQACIADSKSKSIFEERLQSVLREAPMDWGLSKRTWFEFEQKTYALEATSLLGKAGLVFSNASLLVRLLPRSTDPEEILKVRFRLTPSEVRVAMALAVGQDVETMARAFNVSANTIRAHLKMAYAKTETGSQAALVAFIGRLNDRKR